MRNIGILGGLSVESTIIYYQQLAKLFYGHFGDFTSPEIIIHSFNFQDVIDQKYIVSDKVVSTIESLHNSGADFVVAACNSVHAVYDDVVQKIPIPWISIIDTVIEKLECTKVHRVGILGTSFVMNEEFYHRKLRQNGFESISPSFKEQAVVHHIIYDELCKGIIKESSRQIILKCINSLITDFGIEGIILACTELPSLITQDSLCIPVFDTTQLHIEKTFRFSLKINLE